jgi:hypothetical protein
MRGCVIAIPIALLFWFLVYVYLKEAGIVP